MTTFPRRILALFALIGMFTLAACGSDDEEPSSGGGASTPSSSTEAQGSADVSGNVSVVGIWTGDEQKSFKAVIEGFNSKYPNVKVKYNPAGDNTPTVLGSAVEGGNPPDVAAVGQPGLVKQFQEKG